MSGNKQQQDLGIPSFTLAEANRATNDYFYNQPAPEMSQPRKKKKQLTYGSLRRSTRTQRSGNMNAFMAIQEDPDYEMIMRESGLLFSTSPQLHVFIVASSSHSNPFQQIDITLLCTLSYLF